MGLADLRLAPAPALCRGHFWAVPWPRRLLPAPCGGRGWRRGDPARSAAPCPPGEARRGPEEAGSGHPPPPAQGDPACPPPWQFTPRASSADVFCRIKECVEFKAWQPLPEHLGCSAGDGRQLSFGLGRGIQPWQRGALSLSC